MTGRLLERLAILMASDLADFLEIEGEAGDDAGKEIDRLLVDLRAALGERLATAHVKSKELAVLSETLTDYASKAEFAVSSGRDDLARSALERKLTLTREADAIREELAFLDRESGQLEAAIAKLVDERTQIMGESGSAGAPDQSAQLAELDALFKAEQKK